MCWDGIGQRVVPWGPLSLADHSITGHAQVVKPRFFAARGAAKNDKATWQ